MFQPVIDKFQTTFGACELASVSTFIADERRIMATMKDLSVPALLQCGPGAQRCHAID